MADISKKDVKTTSENFRQTIWLGSKLVREWFFRALEIRAEPKA